MPSDWDTIYDELYLRTYAPLQAGENSRQEALGAAQLADLEPGSDVLDVPCGYGRHSIPLAEAGYHAVGADRSTVLLAEARRRAGKAEWPQWVEADYRQLPFEDAVFDAVFTLFTSLGYYGEEADRQALSEFRRVLRPGGRFVVETMHRDRLMRIMSERSWEPLPDGAIMFEQRRFDPVTGVIETVHTFQPEQGERLSATYYLRIYTITELARLVEEAGFGELEFYGDLDGSDLEPETRLVIVARAPRD